MDERDFFDTISRVLLWLFVFFAAGAFWGWHTDWWAGLLGFLYWGSVLVGKAITYDL